MIVKVSFFNERNGIYNDGKFGIYRQDGARVCSVAYEEYESGSVQYCMLNRDRFVSFLGYARAVCV